MTRQLIVLLGLSTALTAGFYVAFKDAPAPKPSNIEFVTDTLVLPTLEGDNSPYFSRQTKTDEAGRKVEDIYCFRLDHSVAHLFYGKSELLTRVEVYRKVDDKQVLAYEADYDSAGRRVLNARYYGADSKLETKVERQPNGKETYSFFKDGTMIQQVELAVDGTQTTTNFTDGIAATETTPPPAATHDLFFWDAAKKNLRLRVNMLGARLAGFEYFERDGQLDHTGKVLADGSLEFSYMEKGKLRKRQIYRLIGEDWERSYYGLSYSELLGDDGKTVEHKVWLHSNGHLKRHERYNGKTGKLEMGRDFDLEGRTSRAEDFTETGESKQVWVFPASGPRSRGFVPTGMRDYPGSDEKVGSVYDLDGKPFLHSVLDRHPWAFFQTRSDKTDVNRPTQPKPGPFFPHFFGL